MTLEQLQEELKSILDVQIYLLKQLADVEQKAKVARKRIELFQRSKKQC